MDRGTEGEIKRHRGAGWGIRPAVYFIGDSVQTIVYGKKDCGKCEDTKKFLQEKNLEYEFLDLDNWPKNWRDKGIAIAMGFYSFYGTLPIIKYKDEFMLTAKLRGKLRRGQ